MTTFPNITYRTSSDAKLAAFILAQKEWNPEVTFVVNSLIDIISQPDFSIAKLTLRTVTDVFRFTANELLKSNAQRYALRPCVQQSSLAMESEAEAGSVRSGGTMPEIVLQCTVDLLDDVGLSLLKMKEDEEWNAHGRAHVFDVPGLPTDHRDFLKSIYPLRLVHSSWNTATLRLFGREVNARIAFEEWVEEKLYFYTENAMRGLALPYTGDWTHSMSIQLCGHDIALASSTFLLRASNLQSLYVDIPYSAPSLTWPENPLEVLFAVLSRLSSLETLSLFIRSLGPMSAEERVINSHLSSLNPPRLRKFFISVPTPFKVPMLLDSITHITSLRTLHVEYSRRSPFFYVLKFHREDPLQTFSELDHCMFAVTDFGWIDYTEGDIDRKDIIPLLSTTLSMQFLDAYKFTRASKVLEDNAPQLSKLRIGDLGHGDLSIESKTGSFKKNIKYSSSEPSKILRNLEHAQLETLILDYVAIRVGSSAEVEYSWEYLISRVIPAIEELVNSERSSRHWPRPQTNHKYRCPKLKEVVVRMEFVVPMHLQISAYENSLIEVAIQNIAEEVWSIPTPGEFDLWVRSEVKCK